MDTKWSEFLNKRFVFGPLATKCLIPPDQQNKSEGKGRFGIGEFQHKDESKCEFARNDLGEKWMNNSSSGPAYWHVA